MSRATIQLSDKSVARLGPSSLLEIQSARHPEGQTRFWLRIGRLFFLNRERPSDIEFETPLTAGAIRGTEFVLIVAQESTFLAMLDGAVRLTNSQESLDVVKGEQVLLLPDRLATKSRVVQVPALMQWCLYYPSVLYVQELALSDGAKRNLQDSLAAWSRGDVLGALRQVGSKSPEDQGSRIYFASLALAAGEVSQAEKLLDSLPNTDGPVSAIRELIAAVNGQSWAQPPLNTASSWLAHSYYLQAHSDLPGALAAANTAVRLAPTYGLGFTRVAELEFCFDRRRRALEALNRAQELTPDAARAWMLRGFIALADRQLKRALASFERAVELDDSLGDAWLGRALCDEQLGNVELGRQELQVAAALEPTRSLLRTYLGKGFSASGDPKLAEKEFRLAQELDPNDPSPWLYRALLRHQESRVNEAVHDLERSLELNNNRSVFRSKLLLDRDRSIGSADLSALYEDAGLSNPAARAAERAVMSQYGSFSGHLFLANTYQKREDPNRLNLRYETPRESELLLANLLAPPGGGNLSQQLSQQEHLRYFDTRPVGLSSLTEYRSSGDWEQASSIFGTVGPLSYAIDGLYRSITAQHSMADSEEMRFSSQTKFQATPTDGIYLQAEWSKSTSLGVAGFYAPAETARSLRVTEELAPAFRLGWDHQWSPEHRTLLLASHLEDTLELVDPNRRLPFLRLSGGNLSAIEYNDRAAFGSLLRSDFRVNSIELQHAWQTPRQGAIAGARYQAGSTTSDAYLFRVFPPPLVDQNAHGDMDRSSAYAYYHLRPWDSLDLLAGVSYDQLSFPANLDVPPLNDHDERRRQISPKAALSWEVWNQGFVRAAYGRNLGGLYFDNSLRLEPSQLAGFVIAPRSVVPETVVGLVPGAELETWGLGFDQKLFRGTYAGITGEIRTSQGDRILGAVQNSLPVPLPDTPSSIRQSLDFQEREVSGYINQLLGRDWAIGLDYGIVNSQLEGRFPDIPVTVDGIDAIEADLKSTLHHASLQLNFNHPSGVFALWQSQWYYQENRGSADGAQAEHLWQHNAFVGYRWPNRRAELRFGVLNLAGEKPRLSLLTGQRELPSTRTFIVSLRLNF